MNEHTTLPLANDPETMASPFAMYGDWRRTTPVARATTPNGDPVWVVTRYHDVRAALADPRLSVDKGHARGGFRGFDLPPALDRNLLNIDPPDHTRLRSLVSPAFTAEHVEALRPRIEAIVDDLLDSIAPAGHADLIADFAAPLSLTAIGQLLGIPPEDCAAFREWTNQLMTPTTPAHARDAVTSMSTFLLAAIAAKRRTPADDLLTAIIAAHDNDELSDDELVSLVFLVLWTGFEAVVDLLGVAVVEMLRHPEQFALLRTDPQMAGAAVDELVRFVAPTPYAIRRFATVDITIGDVCIPAGETVLLNLAAANRDPDVFADPDVLDIRRGDVGRHLGFGRGVHHCLGAPLTRIEVAAALTTLATRFPALALAIPSADLQWRGSWRSRGLVALPVTF